MTTSEYTDAETYHSNV